MKNEPNSTSRQDVYSRITSQIVASLEQGVRRGSGPGTPSTPPADHAPAAP